MARVNALHAAWYALRMLAVQVVVEPVREGGPQPRAWSRPVRRAMLVLALVYAALLLASLLSRLAPEPPTAPFTLSQPGRWLVSIGTGAVLYSLYVASVHLRLWLQVLIGIALAGPLVTGLSASFLLGDALGGAGPMVFFVVLVPLHLASWVTLIVLGLRQRRRALTGRWLLAVAGVFLVAHTIPHVVANLLDDGSSPTVQVMTFLTMMVLLLGAMPLAIAAGVAFAEITLRAVSWSATTLRDEGPRWLGPVAVALLVVGHAYAFWTQIGPAGLRTAQAGRAAAVAVAMIVPTQVAVWLARRRGPVEAPRPLDLADQVPGLALLLGVCGTVGTLVVGLVGLSRTTLGVSNAAIGAVSWVLAGFAVRRGQTARAALAASFGTGYLLFGAWSIGLDLVRDTVTNRVFALLLLGLFAWWGLRGLLTAGRWLVVALGLALTLVFPSRQMVADPLNLLVNGVTGTLIFGLVWRVLTDAGFTRRGSARFPVDARAFAFAAFVLTAATAVITVTYGQGNAAYDLEAKEDIGNIVMGRYVLLAAVVGLVELGRFHVDPDPRAPLPPAAPGPGDDDATVLRPSPGSR